MSFFIEIFCFEIYLLNFKGENIEQKFFSFFLSLLSGDENFFSILSLFRFTLNYLIWFDQESEKSVFHAVQFLTSQAWILYLL